MIINNNNNTRTHNNIWYDLTHDINGSRVTHMLIMHDHTWHDDITSDVTYDFDVTYARNMHNTCLEKYVHGPILSQRQIQRQIFIYPFTNTRTTAESRWQARGLTGRHRRVHLHLQHPPLPYRRFYPFVAMTFFFTYVERNVAWPRYKTPYTRRKLAEVLFAASFARGIMYHYRTSARNVKKVTSPPECQEPR